MRSGVLRRCRATGLSVARKLAGLLIGGNAGPFRYRRKEWEQPARLRRRDFESLGHALAHLDLAAHAGSRRRQDRRACQGRERGRPVHRLPHAGPGTLPQIFAAAEMIVCTEDSSTMISEAVSARLPVVGVAPAAHRFTDEEQNYRAFLVANNWCRVLPIAALTPESRSPARCPRSSRSRRTRSMRSPPS